MPGARAQPPGLRPSSEADAALSRSKDLSSARRPLGVSTGRTRQSVAVVVPYLVLDRRGHAPGEAVGKGRVSLKPWRRAAATSARKLGNRDDATVGQSIVAAPV